MHHFSEQDDDVEDYTDPPSTSEFIPPFIDEFRDMLVQAAEVSTLLPWVTRDALTVHVLPQATTDEDRAFAAHCIASLCIDDAPAMTEGFTNSNGVRFEATKPILKFIKVPCHNTPTPTHTAQYPAPHAGPPHPPLAPPFL